MATMVREQKPPAKYTGARKRIRLWMMFMVIFFGWGIYTLFHQTLEVADQRVQLQEKEKQHQEVQEQRNLLQQEIAKLNDPEYIGQIARKKQDMYLPGEVPIRR